MPLGSNTTRLATLGQSPSVWWWTKFTGFFPLPVRYRSRRDCAPPSIGSGRIARFWRPRLKSPHRLKPPKNLNTRLKQRDSAFHFRDLVPWKTSCTERFPRLFPRRQFHRLLPAFLEIELAATENR